MIPEFLDELPRSKSDGVSANAESSSVSHSSPLQAGGVFWLKNKAQIPHKSGVYIFKDSKSSVLYVGKAIDLFSRVSSYFQRVTGKTTVMVSKIASLETIIVESELEALILEANLIKKYLPPFNVRLVDDKDYLYIGITNEPFPKVLTVRKQDLKGVKKYFGPFPSSRTVRDTLKQLRKIFPWCSNPPKAENQRSKIKNQKFRACFYYHLGLCPGACVGLIDQKDYNQIINLFSKFLEGKKQELVEGLTSEMNRLSLDQEFEKAARVKKILEGINYLTQPNRVKIYLENPNFLEEETGEGLKQLQHDLGLEKIPARIECYDISNISGQDATGSMVVLTHGGIDKSQYRKFKINISGKPNDVGMHKEMMRRRLKHSEWPFPDLIIIDGGRGQANGVSEVLSESVSQRIPLFGLAKREEWLYPPEGEIIKLSKKSLSLKLLQKIRDEAHRFAISYHRKLHRKAFLGNIQS